MMDEICEEQTPTGYHSKDMITVYDGHDVPTILCGYHELRRHMRRHAAERARLAAANAPCGGPGGWW